MKILTGKKRALRAHSSALALTISIGLLLPLNMQAHAAEPWNYDQSKGWLFVGTGNSISGGNSGSIHNVLWGENNKIIYPGTAGFLVGHIFLRGQNNTATNSSLIRVDGNKNNIENQNFTYVNGNSNNIKGGQSNSVYGHENTLNSTSRNNILGSNWNIDGSSNVMAFGSSGSYSSKRVGAGFDGAVLFDQSPVAGTSVVKMTVGGIEYNVAGQMAKTGDVMMVGDRQIKSVAAGVVNANSKDAVNGSQLNAAVMSINTVSGRVTTVDNRVTQVDGRVNNLNTQVINFGGRVTNVEGSVTNILNGTAGLVQQVGGAPGTGNITIGKDTGGSIISVKGTGGDRHITDLLAGIDDTDAVNVKQLKGVVAGFGGDALVMPDGTIRPPTYILNNVTYRNVGDALSDLDTRAIDMDGQITNIDNRMTYVEYDVQNIQGNVTSIVNGTAGLVQQNGGAPGVGEITIGKHTGGTMLYVEGTDGERLVRGLLDGQDDRDAVSMRQLRRAVASLGGGATFNYDGTYTGPTYNINGDTYNTVGDALTNIDGRVINIAGDVTNIIQGTAGLVRQEGGVPGSGEISVGKYTGGTVVDMKGTDGDRQITGVKAGSWGNDAVNVEQLSDTLKGLGGGAQVGYDGTVTGPKYELGGHDYNNVGDALTYLDQRANDTDGRITNIEGDITNINNTLTDHGDRITNIEGDVTNINNTLTEHGDRITNVEGDISNIINGTAGLVQQDGGAPGNGDITVGKDTGGTVVNMSGTDGDRQVTGLLAGGKDNDAVNVSQLQSALDGLGGGATVNPDGTVTGPTYNIGGNTYTTVEAALNAGLNNDLAVQYVADSNGKPTNRVELSGDGTGAPVQIANVAAGTQDHDAVNYSQIKNNVSYDTNADGTRSNSITLSGGASGPVVIQNVAEGKQDTDAVNVKQLNNARQEAKDYTDQKFSEVNNRFDALSGEIYSTRKEARGGIASAMAAAGLRYDDREGKASVAAAMGGFKGATSIAAGVGYTTEGGNWRFNTAVAHSFSTNDTSWNVGASWTFN